MTVLSEVLGRSVVVTLPSAAFIQGVSALVPLADVPLPRSKIVRLRGGCGLRGGATADRCPSQNLLEGLSKALAFAAPVRHLLFLFDDGGGRLLREHTSGCGAPGWAPFRLL